MNYSPHLLDALARVHAEAAVDRLIRDEIAMQGELKSEPKQRDPSLPADTEKEADLDGPAGDESSDNLTQSPSEPKP